jgi:hypothetical protein
MLEHSDEKVRVHGYKIEVERFVALRIAQEIDLLSFTFVSRPRWRVF